MNFQFKKIRIKNTKIVFIVLILLLIFCILSYSYLFYVSYSKDEFVNQSIKIAEGNELAVFKISKILLFSSGNAIDNSSNRSLQNLDICQYTDISIYIDNTSSISDLTTQNTVKELWIDNINITTSNPDVGSPILNYKNPNSSGIFENLNLASNNRIDFNIINTNEQNETADYSQPTFYTDCSNPISLGYINKGIVKNYSIHDDVNSVVFNGKILEQTGVNLEDICYNLKFDIHIKNYDDDSFVYHANIDVNLNTDSKDILAGSLYETRNSTDGSEFIFFREVS